jgi:acetolactate synthase-1/2/3 large subunit
LEESHAETPPVARSGPSHVPERRDARGRCGRSGAAEGKPLAMICHGVVGLQHATMAMYNAWCDRVPVYVMGGTIIEANKRGTTPEWVHAAVDIAAGVRDYTKWDDQPISLQHSPSRRCAYKIATTPPMGPVMLSLDAELQGRQKLESLRRRNVPETVTLDA